jgi:hypothetical protein
LPHIWDILFRRELANFDFAMKDLEENIKELETPVVKTIFGLRGNYLRGYRVIYIPLNSARKRLEKVERFYTERMHVDPNEHEYDMTTHEEFFLAHTIA